MGDGGRCRGSHIRARRWAWVLPLPFLQPGDVPPYLQGRHLSNTDSLNLFLHLRKEATRPSLT